MSEKTSQIEREATAFIQRRVAALADEQAEIDISNDWWVR
jgi:hypothetical protein